MIVEFSETPAFPDTARVRSLLGHAFESVSSTYGGEWTCTVVLADTATISGLHEAFFGDPSDTDVMSFPSGEGSSSDGGYLGDIAISATIAGIQAAEQGHSLEREIAYLALHGLLHLLGWDDADQKMRREMHELQDTLLQDYECEIGCKL